MLEMGSSAKILMAHEAKCVAGDYLKMGNKS
jgi:hypothetical protein